MGARKKKELTYDQQYELVPVDEVQPHPDNPRKSALLEIEVSIAKNGWYGTCTVQRSTGYILVGNHRYLAAVAHGAKEVPVTYVDVDDATATRIMLADNRIADLGTYDSDKLYWLLGSLPSLEGTGYEELIDGAAKEKAEKTEKEPVPDDNYEPMFGVIVLCADEEEQEAVYEKLTNEGYSLKVVAV